MNAPWLTYGCTHVLDVIVFCVGNGDNLVEKGHEENEGKGNQIDVDNEGIDDGDTNSNNVNAND